MVNPKVRSLTWGFFFWMTLESGLIGHVWSTHRNAWVAGLVSVTV
jgi:phenylalanine-4-hydroxylase